MPLAMDATALQAFLSQSFPEVQEDFVVVDAVESGVTVKLVPAPRHLRPGGTVSGPTMFALADVGMYLAILSRLGEVPLAVTTNCSIDFMRKPAADRPILCRAQVLKLGRVLAVGDSLIFNEGEENRPLARAGLTYSIPPKA